MTQLVKNLPTIWETWVWSLGWEDPLEKGKATHSSILAWRIPWTVPSMWLQRVGHDSAVFTFWYFTSRMKKRKKASKGIQGWCVYSLWLWQLSEFSFFLLLDESHGFCRLGNCFHKVLTITSSLSSLRRSYSWITSRDRLESATDQSSGADKLGLATLTQVTDIVAAYPIHSPLCLTNEVPAWFWEASRPTQQGAMNSLI